MADEHAGLVERLRACANGVGSFKTYAGDFGLCDEAADAIASLTAERDEARQMDAMTKTAFDRLADDCDVLRAIQTELIKERDAAEARAQAAEGEWLPIESAPKDGTPVLVYGAWAGEIGGVSAENEIACCTWYGSRSDYPGDDWWQVDGSDAYAAWVKATHWRPLPPPPAPAGGTDR